MLFHLQDRLEEGDQVQLVSPTSSTDLTLAFQALLALISPAATLARHSSAGRRGLDERIVAAEAIQALQEALEAVSAALDALDIA